MRRLGLAAIICAVSSFCQAGDLTVYAPGNSREAVSEAIAQFESRTGKKIDVVFAGVADMRERLDRSEAMAEAKAIKTETGKGAVPVSDGRAEIGIAQSSELVGLPNVASTRLLPSDPKGMTVLQAAVSSSAKAPALAHEFIAAVTASDARKLRVKWGFVDE